MSSILYRLVSGQTGLESLFFSFFLFFFFSFFWTRISSHVSSLIVRTGCIHISFPAYLCNLYNLHHFLVPSFPASGPSVEFQSLIDRNFRWRNQTRQDKTEMTEQNRESTQRHQQQKVTLVSSLISALSRASSYHQYQYQNQNQRL
ncbi:hypothetical protein C8Q69DRAFT_89580 [Paecilomyces variotii]|uniref:Uncharacterized protein n=1 Tax=Byssochlamys spectabilis TaxID=264951 RepID=A0A443HLQ2_BYSSP|nr:hypothetical protein C8Q69DRAFT_89580 [Paecilomyces variotii]RWQ92735.1 hypothetical protein C8Q69DRAFT_89580 [Paecilomyces variotii]